MECFSSLEVHVENSLGASCLKSMGFQSRWSQVRQSCPPLPPKNGVLPKMTVYISVCADISLASFSKAFVENTDTGTCSTAL